MTKRLLGLVCLAALLLAVFAGAAVAAENGLPRDLPDISEIGTQSETAQRFMPEPAEEQPFTEALVYPLLAVGFLALFIVGLLYLKWQPEFGRSDSKRR
jgi:hypothetical protein